MGSQLAQALAVHSAEVAKAIRVALPGLDQLPLAASTWLVGHKNRGDVKLRWN